MATVSVKGLNVFDWSTDGRTDRRYMYAL